MKLALNEYQFFLLFSWIANTITAVFAIHFLCWILHHILGTNSSEHSSVGVDSRTPKSARSYRNILEIIHRIGAKWRLRRRLRFAPVLVVVSMIYGFLLIYGLDTEYRPWDARLKRGLLFTIQGHLGIWLAMMDIRGKARFLVAAIFFPSLFGIPLLWWNLHLSLAVLALLAMGWLMFLVLMEK